MVISFILFIFEKIQLKIKALNSALKIQLNF